MKTEPSRLILRTLAANQELLTVDLLVFSKRLSELWAAGFVACAPQSDATT